MVFDLNKEKLYIFEYLFSFSSKKDIPPCHRLRKSVKILLILGQQYKFSKLKSNNKKGNFWIEILNNLHNLANFLLLKITPPYFTVYNVHTI